MKFEFSMPITETFVDFNRPGGKRVDHLFDLIVYGTYTDVDDFDIERFCPDDYVPYKLFLETVSMNEIENATAAHISGLYEYKKEKAAQDAEYPLDDLGDIFILNNIKK